MNDKALHMIAGLIISLVLGWIYNPLIGLAVAIVAGIAKEIWDYCGHGTSDFKDALTTAHIIKSGLSWHLTIICTKAIPSLRTIISCSGLKRILQLPI